MYGFCSSAAVTSAVIAASDCLTAVTTISCRSPLTGAASAMDDKRPKAATPSVPARSGPIRKRLIATAPYIHTKQSSNRSEFIADPGRHADLVAPAPGGRTRAAVVDERKVGGIVTIGLETVATGADIVVRIAVVHG